MVKPTAGSPEVNSQEAGETSTAGFVWWFFRDSIPTKSLSPPWHSPTIWVRDYGTGTTFSFRIFCLAKSKSRSNAWLLVFFGFQDNCLCRSDGPRKPVYKLGCKCSLSLGSFHPYKWISMVVFDPYQYSFWTPATLEPHKNICIKQLGVPLAVYPWYLWEVLGWDSWGL